MSRLLLLLAVCSLLVAACGSDDKSEDATPTPDSAQSAQEETGCQAVSDPGSKDVGKLAKPKTKLSASKTYVATISTNCGDFEITLDSKRAPKTGGSFKYLADKGFFDNTTFHRIEGNFVIQGGDPTETQSGDAGYKVEEEPPANLEYTKGVVAMAKSETEPPGTSGSQFFVVTAADAGLPAEYALVGKVSEGMDVVETIGKLGTPEEKPKQPVLIKKMTIEPG